MVRCGRWVGGVIGADDCVFLAVRKEWTACSVTLAAIRLCNNFQAARNARLAAPAKMGRAAFVSARGKLDWGAGNADWLSAPQCGQ